MSSIVSAFDKHLTAKQIGEKGHVENSWAVDYEQQVVQFFFQLVRSKDTSDLEGGVKKLIRVLLTIDYRIKSAIKFLKVLDIERLAENM